MQVASEIQNPEEIDPAEYIRQKEEYEDKRDEFMRKHLNRAWPVRLVCLLGIIQLLIALAILGVDLPIILMFAPRWQVFAGCWTFIFTFIACVSTLHSTRKMTWLKLKWAVALNVIGGLAAAVMTAFDILYLVNSQMCLVVSGCNYLSYTYAAVPPYYTGQVIVGIAFLLTVFVFLILFIKYGIGGTILFENVQKGLAPPVFDPIIPPNGATPPQSASGSGLMMNRPPPGPMPRYPAAGPGVAMYGAPNPAMMQGPRGPMMGPNPMMMPRLPGPPMMQGPRGPMMMPRPPGPPMMQGPRGPIMVPIPRGPMMPPGPMPGYYRQPGPYPYQN